MATELKTNLADFISKKTMKDVDDRLAFLSKRIADLINETTGLRDEFRRLSAVKKEMTDFIATNKKV